MSTYCDSIEVILGEDGKCKTANEGESSDLTWRLVDRNAPLILAAVQTLTLTLQDRLTGQIINNRDDLSVLNANGGRLVEETGQAVLYQNFSPLDNVIVGNGYAVEEHITTLKWTWQDGFGVVRTGIHQGIITVKPQDKTQQNPGWPG